jgi:hypothetical protein
MNNKLSLALGAVVLAIVSAAAGVAVSLFYFSKPFEKWQVQFSETYLHMKANALKTLRQGDPKKATEYLEMTTVFSIITLGQQKTDGDLGKLSDQTNEAIRYVCDHPSGGETANRPSGLSIGEACAMLHTP